jgi:hypothetical protein
MPLPFNLVADMVFLMVRRMLLRWCDMAVVLGNRPMLVATQHRIFLMHLIDHDRMVFRLNTGVLVDDVGVYWIAMGMIPVPLRLGMRANAKGEERGQRKRITDATVNDHRTKLLTPNPDWFRSKAASPNNLAKPAR